MALKINLGCADAKKSEYVNIDIDPQWKPDVLRDLTRGIPYSDETVDKVYARKSIAGLWDTYYEYLCSAEWREKSDEFISLHPLCSLCLAPKKKVEYKEKHKPFKCRSLLADNTCYNDNHYFTIQVWTGKSLVCHHKSYEHVGSEKRAELVVLCHDCHREVHANLHHFLNPKNNKSEV